MRLTSGERWLNVLIAIAILALVPLGVLLGTSIWDGMWDRQLPDCGDWSFDQDAWEAEATRDDQALALVRCNTLEGMTLSEVAAMLGTRRRSDDEHRWVWTAGDVDDSLGPGDAQALFVNFAGDRAVRASLRYGGSAGRPSED